jgi:hypothetical protein
MSREYNMPDDVRQYDRVPGSPFYDDPTDSPDFEDKREELTIDRIQDVEGTFLESFTEADTLRLQELSEAVLLPADEKSSIRIGDIVRQMAEDYCTPTDEQVLEELNQEPVAYGTGMNKANAQLISAASELLSALEELSDLMQDVISGEYKPDSFTLQPAIAAIKKAKGET